MKTSFSTLGCPYYSIDEIISMATGNGYSGVEIRAVGGTVELWTLPEFSGGGLAATSEKFADNGLTVVCVGTSINFCVTDAAYQNAGLETAKKYIEIANGLNCAYIRTFGGPLPPVQGYMESIEWSREGYEKLCALTGRQNVSPLLETHDDFSTAARVLDILDGVGAQNIGVIWDILHSYRFGEPLAVTYEKLKDRIRHVHLKDSAVFSPTGFDLVLTGDGNVPILDSISVLQNGGYDGFYSFEWEKLWHPEIPEPDIAMPHFSNYIKTNVH